MTFHSKYNQILQLIKAKQPVHLVGPAGSGKTTLLQQVATELGLDCHSLTLTRQTSEGNLLGFKSVTGEYIPSRLRHIVEHGGLLDLSEINAADPNVLICLNSIENGYIEFPDKRVDIHPDFRLAATSNPDDNVYSGRSKLDFSTTDRYLTIFLDLDTDLEASLTSPEFASNLSLIRKALVVSGVSQQLTMRGALKLFNIESMNLFDSPIDVVLFSEDPDSATLFHSQYSNLLKTWEKDAKKRAEEAERLSKPQSEATDLDDLWDKIHRGM